MAWNTRKFAFVGIVVAIILAIQAFGLLFVSIFGFGAAGPIMFFVTPALFIICSRVVEETGAISLAAFILGLIFLPLPALGPPGFLPKFVFIMGAALLFEGVYYLLKDGNRTIAGGVSGGIFVAVLMLLAIFILRMFDIPGDNVLLRVGAPIALVGFVEGLLGGIVGEKIYKRIEDRPVVTRFQS